ncbi:MAG: hypothetical protein GEV08_06250 [Acidimicrobiia bacterium]|nr:hypothetical protein [Acidimicrobiia bacterium]
MAEAVIAIVGMVATLTAALLSPLVAGRVERKRRREDNLLAVRSALYVDVMRVVVQVKGQLERLTWAPGAPRQTPDEPAEATLADIEVRVRVYASPSVRTEVHHFMALYGQTMVPLIVARATAPEPGEGSETPDAMRARLELGRHVDELAQQLTRVQRAVNADLAS